MVTHFRNRDAGGSPSAVSLNYSRVLAHEADARRWATPYRSFGLTSRADTWQEKWRRKQQDSSSCDGGTWAGEVGQ